jgi:hypothetical protein
LACYVVVEHFSSPINTGLEPHFHFANVESTKRCQILVKTQKLSYFVMRQCFKRDTKCLVEFDNDRNPNHY